MERQVESTRNTISESMGTEKWIPLTAALHQMLLQPNTGSELNMTCNFLWIHFFFFFRKGKLAHDVQGPIETTLRTNNDILQPATSGVHLELSLN